MVIVEMVAAAVTRKFQVIVVHVVDPYESNSFREVDSRVAKFMIRAVSRRVGICSMYFQDIRKCLTIRIRVRSEIILNFRFNIIAR
jgi:hypothetical protein